MKHILSIVLALLMVLSVFAGCKDKEPAKNEKVEKPFKIAKTLTNLVENGRFETDTNGWILKGGAKHTTEKSRNSTDTGSLVIEGEGAASYVASDVKPGKYQLRLYTYDMVAHNSIEITVFVNQAPIQRIVVYPRGYWIEYVSNIIEIEEKSEISFRVNAFGASGKLIVDEVQLLLIPYDTPEPVTGENPVSCLRKREDGTYYIEVNGNPTMFNFVHLYDEHKKYSLDEMAAKAKEAGYNCFIPAITHGFFWRDVQPNFTSTPDFTKLNEILEVAEKYDMYVDLQWYGIGYGASTEGAPTFVKSAHDFHSKKPDGTCDTYSLGYECCIADYGNEKLLETEKKVFKQFIEYIAKKDVNKRIVGIEIECESTEAIYHSHQVTVEKIANYINELGKLVKESAHPMITHVNLGYGMAPHFMFNTPYIDMNGSDPYAANAGVTERLVASRFDTRIPHIMENCGFNNINTHVLKTVAQGGHLSMYPINDNSWNGTNGVYGEDFAYMPWTRKLTALNNAFIASRSVLVTVPLKNLKAFNIETNSASNKYSKIQTVGGYAVRMESRSNADAVGLAFVYKDAIYCIADGDAYFSLFGEDVKVEYGTFDKTGKWTATDEKIPLQDCKDGSFRADYIGGKVMKLTTKKKVNPSADKKPLDPVIDLSGVTPLDAPIGKNLIGNFSFEESIEDGWVATTMKGCSISRSTVAAGVSDGKYALNFWNNTPTFGATQSNIYYDVGVVPKGEYEFGFTLWGGKYGEGEFRMQVFVNDKLVLDDALTPPERQQKISATVKITAKSKVRIAIDIDNKVNLGGGYACIDSVKFQRVK